jgi:formimidoylglutamate deiminase
MTLSKTVELNAMKLTHYACDYAWLPDGWASQVVLSVDEHGNLYDVQTNTHDPKAEHIGRYILPGMPNLHSHAFQYAMAGLAEHANHQQDTFWTWRETMYQCAARFDPDGLRAVATELYAQMLMAGYTSVCEFHYLHHQTSGASYSPPDAMSHALIDAAQEAGIGLTLLPTLYMTGGFEHQALSSRQLGFAYSVDQYLACLQRLQQQQNTQVEIGIAFHSLRAVPPDAMFEVLQSTSAKHCPIHIHIAEQQLEVDECLRIRQSRPVDWLLTNVDVNTHWCLVHATHMNRREIESLAASGAVAGLCPTTEANLGDGFFALTPWNNAQGRIGVGSDSQISRSPIEELRWLEYGQRLLQQRRNIVAQPDALNVGDNLWRMGLQGGAQASGRKIGELAAHYRADLLVLDDDATELFECPLEHVMNKLIFASSQNLVRDVMVGGVWVVKNRTHVRSNSIKEQFKAHKKRLAQT